MRRQIYGGGAHTLGFLLSAAGVGALATPPTSRAGTRSAGSAASSPAAAAVSGVALASFAWLTCFPLALVLLVLVGGGVILAAASANTILQTVVDDRLRGRVAGFYTMAFLGIAPLGNLAAGALAKAIGVAGDVRAQRRVVRRSRRSGSGGGCLRSRR